MRQDWRRSEFANPAWRIPRRGENPAKGPQIPAARRLEWLWERVRKDPEDRAATSAGRLFSLYSQFGLRLATLVLLLPVLTLSAIVG